MNVMKTVGLDLDYLMSPNPCIGCTSFGCWECACAGEQPKATPFSRSTEVKKSKKPAKSKDARPATIKPQVKPKPKKPVAGKPRLLTTLPRGIFGSVGEGLILQADGNGMKNAGIHTGDWLVFDTKLSPKDGDIALVTVDDQPMCRRIFDEGGKKRVRREDGVTPDVITDNCVVYAVLIGLMRNVRDPAD